MKPRRLIPGDRVHLVSPASPPTPETVANLVQRLEGLGLVVDVGAHVLDRHGYMAGTDKHQLADLNRALADPLASAVIATRGGKGAYRIADRVDFDGLRANPKLLIGFSELTILQLAVLKHCGIPSIHGAAWSHEFDPVAARSFEHAVFTTNAIVVQPRAGDVTSALTTSGRVEGRLIGGNQDMVATAQGWALPDLDGAILLLEDVGKGLGHVDRQLTRLRKVGALDGIVGVALGQYDTCGPGTPRPGAWGICDVLELNLAELGVPILGGLPLGHGASPIAVPMGTLAQLDANRGVLTIESAVR